MSAYYVKYKMHESSPEKGVCVAARTKADAYDLATYDEIPKLEGGVPYSSWVYSVTYNNGGYRRFNTHEGKAY